MACTDDDRGRSRRPDAETTDGRTGQVLGGQAIERSGGTVYGLYRARGDEEHVILG
jgi:hypothetical protein